MSFYKMAIKKSKIEISIPSAGPYQVPKSPPSFIKIQPKVIEIKAVKVGHTHAYTYTHIHTHINTRTHIV